MFVLCRIAWLTQRPHDDTLRLTIFVNSVFSMKQCQNFAVSEQQNGLGVNLLAPPKFY